MSLSRDTSALPEEEEPKAPDDPRILLARFRKGLEAGSYYLVVGQGLQRTLRGAAADVSLEAEIGALRLTLVRLLNEERDPSRLAAGVSRVAGVAVQAARLRQGPDADLEQIRSMLLREVDALEREYDQQATEEKEALRHDEI